MNRSGEYVRNMTGDAKYCSFRPSPLPPELGILKETANAARNRVFAYEDYLQILRQGT